MLKLISKSIGDLDTFKSYAKTSVLNCYSRPKIIESENSFVRATEMRHPIIENSICKYVANDIELDQTRNDYLWIKWCWEIIYYESHWIKYYYGSNRYVCS